MDNGTETSPAPRRRLSPVERRRQLIEIGLDQLVARPGEALSVEQVAARAQISRGLLFRYFATKQEFFAAVAEAMVHRIEQRLDVDDHGTPEQRQRRLVASYLGVLADHPTWAASISGGDFGVGGEVARVITELRARLVDRSLAILSLAEHAETRVRLSGWWALVHAVGQQTQGIGPDPGTPPDPESKGREAVVAYCVTVQPAVLAG